MRKTHQRGERAMIALLALAAAIPVSASALQQELPAGLALSVVDVDFLERADNSRIYMVDSTQARIDEFIDFGCPTCRSFYILRTDSLKTNLVDTGRANFVVRMFPLARLMRGFHAAEAALCAGGLNDRQGFEAMQHRLYMNQSVWQPLQDPIPVFPPVRGRHQPAAGGVPGLPHPRHGRAPHPERHEPGPGAGCRGDAHIRGQPGRGTDRGGQADRRGRHLVLRGSGYATLGARGLA